MSREDIMKTARKELERIPGQLSDWELDVAQVILEIPRGRLTTYGCLARTVADRRGGAGGREPSRAVANLRRKLYVAFRIRTAAPAQGRSPWTLTQPIPKRLPRLERRSLRRGDGDALSRPRIPPRPRRPALRREPAEPGDRHRVPVRKSVPDDLEYRVDRALRLGLLQRGAAGNLGREIGFPHGSLPPERHSFLMDGDGRFSRFSLSLQWRFTPVPSRRACPVHGSPLHPIRHAPLHLFQSPCSLPVGQVHVHSGSAQDAKARRPATRNSAGSFRACSGRNSCSHHVRTPERRRARDRRRFHQPGVAAFRRRPCRPRRHPAPRLRRERAGHAVAAWPHHSVH